MHTHYCHHHIGHFHRCTQLQIFLFLLLLLPFVWSLFASHSEILHANQLNSLIALLLFCTLSIWLIVTSSLLFGTSIVLCVQACHIVFSSISCNSFRTIGRSLFSKSWQMLSVDPSNFRNDIECDSFFSLFLYGRKCSIFSFDMKKTFKRKNECWPKRKYKKLYCTEIFVDFFLICV